MFKEDVICSRDVRILVTENSPSAHRRSECHQALERQKHNKTSIIATLAISVTSVLSELAPHIPNILISKILFMELKIDVVDYVYIMSLILPYQIKAIEIRVSFYPVGL